MNALRIVQHRLNAMGLAFGKPEFFAGARYGVVGIGTAFWIAHPAAWNFTKRMICGEEKTEE
eukprot:CAMPEP_0114563730 /NCGR_PEP_ID=MMETSP0114-20121206/13288_1 /TAXON_ID=31324 /ORGANISM="Goniomonas sp, Strain m" /LENGTH=61 /DNA_ID=CAMNT_0001749641 /DNA_START=14 /DNA_END=199 /DNA_ORIENTATION=-